MASHGHPILYALDMVKYHPRILQITFALDAPYIVQPTFWFVNEHFENVHLHFTLALEDVVVYEFEL